MARFILGHRLRALGARSERAERVLFQIDRWFFASLLWLIRRLPVEHASRFGAWIGATLGPRFNKKSRALEQNLQVAFPHKSEAELAQIARGAWANAGAVFAEYAHLEEIFDVNGNRLEIEMLGDFRTLHDPTAPSIFVAAHQANWEMSGAAITRLGIPLAAVYSPPTNPLLDAMLYQWRSRLGCELLPRDESMRPMLRALAHGRSLGLIVDRRVDSGSPVALFGHDKPTTLVPARLALRAGCELVPVRIERLEGARFRVSFHPPVVVPANDGDEIERARMMMRAVNALIEQWVVQRPAQWLCSKRLWPRQVYAEVASLAAAAQHADAAG